MNPTNPQTRPALDTDRQAWDDYVLNHPKGLAYQLYAWKDAVEAAYNFECTYFIALEEDRVCGVFPLVHIHLPLCKGSLVSLPYCDAGGILANSKDVAEHLLQNALSCANERGIQEIEIRSSEPVCNLPEEETRNREKVRMILSLPWGADLLMSSLKSKVRSQARKPAKDGLKAKIGGVDLLEDFYPLFAENMRDLGSPVHSRKWIGQVLQSFGERARCCVVYMGDGEPAAGGVILLHSQTVSIPWASSLRRLNRWNPNMLLYWTFLEYASNEGYAFFDFGRSTPGEGTYKFKEQWGAQPEPLYWMTFSANAAVRGNGTAVPKQESPSLGRGRQMAEKVIQKMPLALSEWFGSRVRKYISL